MKKDLLSTLVDSICVVLLSVCPLFCYASAFSVNFTSSVLIISAVMFSAVFSLLASFVNEKLKYALSMTVIAFVLFLVFVIANESLSSQANYALNKLLEQYSAYLPVYSSITFAEYHSNDATGLFVLISAVFSGLFSFLISKLKSVKIVTLLSVALLVPCFVLVNTLPEQTPLLIIFIVLFALYFSSQARRLNYDQSGVITAAAAGILAVLITFTAIIYPVADYKRPEWQDELLTDVKKITGMKTYDGKISSALAEVGNSLNREVDFSNAGSLTQTGKKIMTVTSGTSGRLYLKGIAYANYENNKWSVLTDEQAESFPSDYQPFLMTMGYTEQTEISISTVNAEGVIYTPYYLSEFNDNFSNVCDVLVPNSDKTTSYTMLVTPYIENSSDSYSRTPSNDMHSYDSFADCYLQLPDDTKQAMLEIAEENEITGLSDIEKIYAVKKLVSHCASYSLNTQKVPEGRDAAEWFLNDAKTGYCMHFANSAAVMLRALGIPARYVTGYCADVVNGKAVVTSDNAHAWVEYFDKNTGWIPLDATPADFTVPRATESVQPSTQPQTTTTPAIQPTTQKPAAPQKTYVKTNISVPALTVVIISLLLIAFIIRIIVARLYRKYSFTHRNNKAKVICIYRYLNRLSVHSKRKLPERIEKIGTKARYSNHRISYEEYKCILNYVPLFRKAVLNKAPLLKKLYLVIILGL